MTQRDTFRPCPWDVRHDRDKFWTACYQLAASCLGRLRKRGWFFEIEAADVALHKVKGEPYLDFLRRRALSGEIRGAGGVMSSIKTMCWQLVCPEIRVETSRLAKRPAVLHATTATASGGDSPDDVVTRHLADDDDAGVAAAVSEALVLIDQGLGFDKAAALAAESCGVEKRRVTLGLRELGRRVAVDLGRDDLLKQRRARPIGPAAPPRVTKAPARPRRRKTTSQEGQGGPIDTSRGVGVG